jgi:hypothetical protein
MSTTIAINIRKLIEPFMVTMHVRPTRDDGLHIVGMDRNGYWQEFATIEQAADFANRERFKDMQAKAATP